MRVFDKINEKSIVDTFKYKPCTGHSHAPSEKITVSVNVLTVDQLLQLRNSLGTHCVRRVTAIASLIVSDTLYSSRQLC